MPISILELARESFFRPRTAAPYLIGLNLTRNTIVQAAMLLAVLTVLSQYLLFVFVQNQATDVWSVQFPMPLADVVVQFVTAYIVSQIVVILARAVSIDVKFRDAMAIYLWFNLLLVALLAVMIVTSFMVGAAGLIIILFTIVWGPYCLAVFWSELLQTKNLFMGFFVGMVAFLLATAISAVLVGVLGLPVMEIVPNV